MMLKSFVLLCLLSLFKPCVGQTCMTKEPDCESWCADDKKKWKDKCTWLKCSLCDECDNMFCPTPTDPPTASPTISPYANFGMPFSSVNEPRNVVVLKQEFPDGGYTYRLRMRYANANGDSIRINGVDTVFQFHAVYGTLVYDAFDNLMSASKSIDGMDDETYAEYYGSSVSYLIDALTQPPTLSLKSTKTVESFSPQGPVRTLTRRRTTYNNGFVSQKDELLGRFYTLSSGFEVNGINFGDDIPIRYEHRVEGGSRLRAQGIGVVEFFYPNAPSGKAIYYNVDGQSGGTLAGTPLEEGTDAYNLFF